MIVKVQVGRAGPVLQDVCDQADQLEEGTHLEAEDFESDT